MPVFPPEERAVAIYQRLEDDLQEIMAPFGMPSSIIKRILEVVLSLKVYLRRNSFLGKPNHLKVFHTSTHGGKYLRLRMTYLTGEYLAGEKLSSDQFEDLVTLGWLVEMVEAYLCITDDIVDMATTRRGRPCWHLRPNVGNIAIMDALVIKSAVIPLLQKRFGQHPAYIEMANLFNEAGFTTDIGQLWDILNTQEEDPTNWRLNQVYAVYELKCAFYSHYLPTALGLHYLGLATPLNLRQTKQIMMPLGSFMQLQNDFADIYGDPAVTKKESYDIQRNVCSWTIIKALDLANPQDREFLKQNYGSHDEETVSKIRALMNSLPVPELYKTEAFRRIADIRLRIEDLDESEGLMKEYFKATTALFHGIDSIFNITDE